MTAAPNPAVPVARTNEPAWCAIERSVGCANGIWTEPKVKARCWCCGAPACATCATYVQVPKGVWVVAGGSPQRSASRRRRRVCRDCWPPPWLART